MSKYETIKTSHQAIMQLEEHILKHRTSVIFGLDEKLREQIGDEYGAVLHTHYDEPTISVFNMRTDDCDRESVMLTIKPGGAAVFKLTGMTIHKANQIVDVVNEWLGE